MRCFAVIGLLFVAGSAQAASARLPVPAGEAAFLQALQTSFQAEKALYTIPLPKLLDNTHATSTSFMAGATKVHVFGDQSDPKASWFVGFAPEGGAPLYFNAMKMVQWMGIGGSARFEIGGKKFVAHVDANLAHLLKSRVVIETDDEEAKTAASFTAKEISEASYQAGHPLSLNGKYYRLLYFRNFTESADGKFDAFSGKRSIVLMFRDNGGFAGYQFYESAIASDKVVFQTPSYVDSDGKRKKGDLTLGLRLTKDKELEIHLPPK